MILSDKDKKNYLYLEKGFRGELAFDERVQVFSFDGIFLNDLLLEANNTIFQIDSLLITREKVYLFEVKNFEGDFYVQGDKWYTIAKKQITSPLLQLERCDSLFQQSIRNFGFNLPIESYLVFIHPEFNLYQAPTHSPIIFQTQLDRFLKKLSANSPKLSHTHTKLANQVLSIHIKESPYERLPPYSFEQLEKGLMCSACLSLEVNVCGLNSICQQCGVSEKAEKAILRNIRAYQLLFPDKKITTKAIYKWCKIIKSDRKIRSILLKHFNSVGFGKHRYYVEPNTRENVVENGIEV